MVCLREACCRPPTGDMMHEAVSQRAIWIFIHTIFAFFAQHIFYFCQFCKSDLIGLVLVSTCLCFSILAFALFISHHIPIKFSSSGSAQCWLWGWHCSFPGCQLGDYCGKTSLLFTISSEIFLQFPFHYCIAVQVIRGKRACIWGSIYLDAFGEEDRELKWEW